MPLVLLLMVLQYEPLTLKQYDVTAVDITEIEDAVLRTLRDTDTLEEVAKQSYLHQNGFFKHPLKTLDGEKFRLHLYPVGAKADENIHNHRWDFESKVICGTLPMYLYNIIEGDTHYLHTYIRNDRIYNIELENKVGVIESPIINIEAGKKYLMKNDIHHKIAPVKELTITYMVTRKTSQKTCDLININNMSSSGEGVEEPPLTVEQVRDNLKLILKKIQTLKELV